MRLRRSNGVVAGISRHARSRQFEYREPDEARSEVIERITEPAIPPVTLGEQPWAAAPPLEPFSAVRVALFGIELAQASDRHDQP